jgi:hypothetical protein
MKVIKGLICTIVLFIAISIGMAIVGALVDKSSVASLFSGTAAISTLMFGGLSTSFGYSITNALSNGATTPSTILILSICIPAGVAAALGSIIEKKSGSSGSIFLATFLGLVICLGLGIIIAIPDTMNAIKLIGLVAEMSVFVSIIIFGVLNAAFWSSIGLIITSKGWS